MMNRKNYVAIMVLASGFFFLLTGSANPVTDDDQKGKKKVMKIIKKIDEDGNVTVDTLVNETTEEIKCKMVTMDISDDGEQNITVTVEGDFDGEELKDIIVSTDDDGGIQNIDIEVLKDKGHMMLYSTNGEAKKGNFVMLKDDILILDGDTIDVNLKGDDKNIFFYKTDGDGKSFDIHKLKGDGIHKEIIMKKKKGFYIDKNDPSIVKYERKKIGKDKEKIVIIRKIDEEKEPHMEWIEK